MPNTELPKKESEKDGQYSLDNWFDFVQRNDTELFGGDLTFYSNVFDTYGKYPWGERDGSLETANINTDVLVVGDLHGRAKELLERLDEIPEGQDKTYMQKLKEGSLTLCFLGDYIHSEADNIEFIKMLSANSRKPITEQSEEPIPSEKIADTFAKDLNSLSTVLLLKMAFQKNVFLVRGNHDDDMFAGLTSKAAYFNFTDSEIKTFSISEKTKKYVMKTFPEDFSKFNEVYKFAIGNLPIFTKLDRADKLLFLSHSTGLDPTWIINGYNLFYLGALKGKDGKRIPREVLVKRIANKVTKYPINGMNDPISRLNILWSHSTIPYNYQDQDLENHPERKYMPENAVEYVDLYRDVLIEVLKKLSSGKDSIHCVGHEVNHDKGESKVLAEDENYKVVQVCISDIVPILFIPKKEVAKDVE